MGSYGDDETAMKIRDACESFDISCELRVTSAHKGPDATLKVVAEYEGLSELLYRAFKQNVLTAIFHVI